MSEPKPQTTLPICNPEFTKIRHGEYRIDGLEEGLMPVSDEMIVEAFELSTAGGFYPYYISAAVIDSAREIWWCRLTKAIKGEEVDAIVQMS